MKILNRTLARLGHLSVVLSMLLSNAGLVVQKHYCRDTIRDVALYQAAESCHRPAVEMPAGCPMHRESPACDGREDSGCCHDESRIEKLDVPQWNSAPDQLSAMPDMGPAALPATTGGLAGRLQIPVQPYFNYKPPPLFSVDPQAFLQVYRC